MPGVPVSYPAYHSGFPFAWASPPLHQAPSPLHVSCPVPWTLSSRRSPPPPTSYAQVPHLTATFDPSCVIRLFWPFFFNIWALDCSIPSQSIIVSTSSSGLHDPSPQTVLPILSSPLIPKTSSSTPWSWTKLNGWLFCSHSQATEACWRLPG